MQAPCRRLHLFHGDPIGHKRLYALHLWLESRTVTALDLHLRLASRTSLSWSIRSIRFVLCCSIFHRGLLSKFKFFVSLLCIICQSFCHNELWTSSFLVEGLDVFPKNTVQLPFHFEAFMLGFVDVALHLFDQVSCFVLLFSSLSKLSK